MSNKRKLQESNYYVDLSSLLNPRPVGKGTGLQESKLKYRLLYGAVIFLLVATGILVAYTLLAAMTPAFIV